MKNKLIILSAFLLLILSGCVDQRQEQGKILNSETPKIIVTSMSTALIFEKLNIDLVAVPESKVEETPEKYKNLPKIGSAMSPDIEKISAMNPDFVFSPVSLIADLMPKFEAASLNYGFLNLSNVEGMFKSIEDLGNLLNRNKEAQNLITEYKKNINEFKKKYENEKKPRVLILMGLPGTYVVATENSYVGDLVKLAGGENVYSENDEQFINVNTEDMLEKNPDIILRTSHAMPDQVKEMFKKDFENNDIWRHFRAVKEKKVYDLDNKKFGMSAKFNYIEALENLGEIFYGK
ncbi:MAG: heme ABC transporter substrate-binding protein IsdE [Peptoniphilaceae bacterium]